jgi:phage tail-like protein
MVSGFVKNAYRIDPYKNFKFRVIMEGKTVLGVSKVSTLKRTTEPVKFRDGNDPSHDSKSPGRTSYESVTLERGITHDPAFEQWANKVHPYGGDSMMDLAGYKRDLILEMMNEKGHVAHRYFLYKAWVSEFDALPDLDANANAVAIERIKLDIESWEHDLNTQEPDEKSDVPV